jgi:hypothetical protein
MAYASRGRSRRWVFEAWTVLQDAPRQAQWVDFLPKLRTRCGLKADIAKVLLQIYTRMDCASVRGLQALESGGGLQNGY